MSIQEKLRSIAELDAEIDAKIAKVATALHRSEIRALNDEINSDIDCFVELKREVSETFRAAGLTSDEIRVMLYRYVNEMKWDEIAQELSYRPEPVVHRIHGSALAKIARLEKQQ